VRMSTLGVAQRGRSKKKRGQWIRGGETRGGRPRPQKISLNKKPPIPLAGGQKSCKRSTGGGDQNALRIHLPIIFKDTKRKGGGGGGRGGG